MKYIYLPFMLMLAIVYTSFYENNKNANQIAIKNNPQQRQPAAEVELTNYEKLKKCLKF